MIIQSEIIRVRVTPRVREIVEEFAIRNTLGNKTGAPNLSAAVRTILELAAANGDQAEVYRIAYANARAEVIQRVSAKYGVLMDELSRL